MLFKSNSFWLGLQYAITVVLSFVTLKLNLKTFGPEMMGMWFSLSAAGGFLFVFDFGMSTSAVVLLAEARSKGDLQQASMLCSSVLVFYAIAGLVLFAGAVTLMMLISSSLGAIALISFRNLFSALLLFGLALYAGYVAQGLRSLLEGMGEYVILSRCVIASSSILAGLVALVFLFHLSLSALAGATLVSSGSLLVFLSITFARKKTGISLGLSHFSMTQVRSLAGLGTAFQVSTIFGSLIDPVIKFIIGKFMMLSDVAYFEVARRFSTAVSGLFSTAFRHLLPRVASIDDMPAFRLFVAGQLKRVTLFGSGYAGLCYGVFALPVYLIMKYWFQSEKAFFVYLLIILPEVINILFYPPYLALIGRKRTRLLAGMQFGNIVIITASVFIGYAIFKSHLSLGGYMLAVLIVDLFMLNYYHRAMNVNLVIALGWGPFVKAGILLLILTGGIGMVLSGKVLFAASFVTLVTALFFWSDVAKSARILIGVNKTVAGTSA